MIIGLSSENLEKIFYDVKRCGIRGYDEAGGAPSL
jgi:hypothetical protein